MRALSIAICLLAAPACASQPPAGSGGRSPAAPDAGTVGPPPAVDRTFFAPGVDPSVATLFGGADDPARAPQLVYPTDGVLVPPNLNELELHFTPGAGNTVYQLVFELLPFRMTVYLRCDPVGAGCAFTPDEEAWRALSEAGRGRDAITYYIRGTDDAGSGVGTSYSRTLLFASEDIVGGLYYWNAPSGQILRYDFGLRGQRAETFLDPARVGATECVGCHALSRDGTRIAVGLDEPDPSEVKVYDVADRAQRMAFGGGDTGGANFFAFSPDATQLAASDGAGIAIRDATTGDLVQRIDGIFGTMPDWSPDGMHIVYTEPPADWCDRPGFEDEQLCVWPLVEGGAIATLVHDGGAWRRGATLVARSAANNFYPTYSPDGQWVLFNRSASNLASYAALTRDDEGTTTDHQLWVISAAGGAPIELAATVSGAGETWPKWDPTAYRHRGEPLFWLSFSSTRGYGLRTADGGPSQLWMAAFVPSRAGAGLDPATPPLRLPFQGDGGGNHIAQWVTRVERPSCTDSTDCAAGEFCDGGRCLPGPI